MRPDPLGSLLLSPLEITRCSERKQLGPVERPHIIVSALKKKFGNSSLALHYKGGNVGGREKGEKPPRAPGPAGLSNWRPHKSQEPQDKMHP